MNKRDYIPKEEFAEWMFSRIKEFAIRCIPVCEELYFKGPVTKNIANQLIRSSSSIAANYRAARRSRSARDFFSKVSIVIEELDESIFWFEYSVEAGFFPESRLQPLKEEASEILKILSKSRKTTSEKMRIKGF